MKRILLFTAAVALFLCGCRRSEQFVYTPIETADPASASEDLTPVSSSGQLLSIAETIQDAEKIAELYGITLICYQDCLAVYHTEKDPSELIRLGAENGWPELSLNHTRKPY